MRYGTISACASERAPGSALRGTVAYVRRSESAGGGAVGESSGDDGDWQPLQSRKGIKKRDKRDMHDGTEMRQTGSSGILGEGDGF
jgi:hypothetical protein